MHALATGHSDKVAQLALCFDPPHPARPKKNASEIVRKRVDDIMRSPMRRHYWLRRASGIVGRYADPEDVLGRVCSRALISGHTYDPSRDFDAWFACIVRTVAWRMCEEAGKVFKHELELIPEERIEVDDEPIDDSFDCDASTNWQKLAAALPLIAVEQRALLEEHYLRGVTIADLAVRHKRTKTAMTIRLQRARAALRLAIGRQSRWSALKQLQMLSTESTRPSP